MSLLLDNILVPIGSKCSVRQSIQRYLKLETMETNLFDWNVTNFETIVYMIENIDNEFKKEDFYDTNEICGHSRMLNHNNLRLNIIHDFDNSNDYDKEMVIFINKYNRRLKRLKQTIMSNKIINFVHLFDIYPNFKIPNQDIYVPNIDQVYRFIMAIKKINENCKFNLHFLVPPIDCIFYTKKYNSNFYVDVSKLNELRITDNIFIHQLFQNENIDPQEHACLHWTWDSVYNNILHN
jgi:hypothetical protein